MKIGLTGSVLLFFVFLAGVLAGLNLATLHPNPGYEAAYWKVAVSIGLSFLFGSLLVQAWKR